MAVSRLPAAANFLYEDEFKTDPRLEIPAKFTESE
jgi:hypothetical protein